MTVDLRAEKKCKHGNPFWDCPTCKHHYHEAGAAVMNYAGIIVSGVLCPTCDIYMHHIALYTNECPSCLYEHKIDPAEPNPNFTPGGRGRRTY